MKEFSLLIKCVLALLFLLNFVLDPTKALSNRVIELSDRFMELRGDSMWLVMFYAPWCGYCRKLEPVWSHVAQALYGTSIRVGKVDATRFSSLASEFSVKAFPTIVFLKSSERHIYYGDRTTADILGFGRRMAGPVLPHISQVPVLPYMPTSPSGKEKEEGGLFIYAGEAKGELYDAYYVLAEKFRPFHYFYSMSEESMKRHLKTPESDYPCIYVYKDGMNIKFNDASSDSLNSSLTQWVNHERFPHFMKITGGNLHQVFETGKYLSLVVVGESKTGILTSDDSFEHYVDAYKFVDLVQTVARDNHDKLHSHFQFGWTGTPSLGNNLAITRLPLPSLIVVNTSSLVYHMPLEEAHLVTKEVVKTFLETVIEGKAVGYGGDSYLMRVWRSMFNARTGLEDMWKGNPVLTALLFGLPLGFLSLIMYSICCTDIMDASEEEMLEEEERRAAAQHEKSE